MADIDLKISELPVAGAIVAGNVLPVVQSGVTKKADATAFKGDTGAQGNIQKTLTSTIEDPTELNSLADSDGDVRQVYQADGQYSLYGYHAAGSASEDPPYSVDGSAGLYELIYSNSPTIPSVRFLDGQDPHGFVDETATLAFDNGTREFTITPVGGSFEFYNQGKKYTKTVAQSKTVSDTNGTWIIYFDNDGAIQASQSSIDWEAWTRCSFVYWDGTTGIILEERHGTSMPWATHEHLHKILGAIWHTGLTASGYTLSTDSDAAVTLGISAGGFRDEDLAIAIVPEAAPSEPFEQVLADPAEIPVVYRAGSIFTRDVATTFPFKNTVAGRVNYNKLNGTWAQQEATDNYFVAYFIVATSAHSGPIMSIQGQREDSSLVTARANNQFSGLVLSGFVSAEIAPLYRLIYNTKNTFGGTRKAEIVEVLDLRGLRVSEGSTLNPTSHNGLTDILGKSPYYHLGTAEYNSINGDGISSALAALEIDMSGDGVKTKTISAPSVFTIVNPQLERVITIILTGDFAITLPATVKNRVAVEAAYDGAKINTLFIYCRATDPEYIANIIIDD